MNTTDRYARIREALEMKPTPGPWTYDRRGDRKMEELPKITTVAYCCDYVIGLPSRYPGGDYRYDPSGSPEADTAFIAACDPDTIRNLLAERDALAAENKRLKEDRARFPDRPDDIGRMIEAHIGNLKAGKKSAEDAADKALDRAFRAEAALANLAAENERLKQEIAATQEKLIRANDELIQRNSKALSRSEVDAIRDQALEEAAAMCEAPRRFHDGSEIVMPSGKAYASAIRKLKSKDRAAFKEANDVG